MWIEKIHISVIQRTLRCRIGIMSLNWWTHLLKTTGRVIQDKETYKRMGRHNQFDNDQLAVLHDMVTNSPSIFLDELWRKMLNSTGKNVSMSTIWHELHEFLGLKLHRTCSMDPHQSPED
ncbi:hypothetical protein CROQUDRAFT_55429 [Cronartium quercuum f. sp. fusiforme G11]|uniref:Uncharacterized protein n=1 Tax=Cronartium quercuum f. sp. fusiforme G11 TaxID=708437 RepID=A0A9P6N7V5_9BASI|nr:hypothetical protein CROQUDRAFT_55429 [Cronartium quercuum f. sp. fusiforme G11]